MAGNLIAPRAMDWLAARLGRVSMTTRDPGDEAQRDNLYEPRADLSLNSSLRPMTRKTSLALRAQLHPGAALTAAAGLAALAWARPWRRRACR